MTHMLETLIREIPKTELHCHIEGTLEPEMMFMLAKRNKITLPYASVEAIREKYKFDNLQSFLNIYYQGMNVLQTEEDYYDLTLAYLKRVKQDNVVHVEIFFDPQAHLIRGIPFSVVVNGIDKALKEGEKSLGITHRLIMCFLRDRSEEEAIAAFHEALPYQDKLLGVGLDSAEVGHPPSKFKRVFEMAEKEGFLTFAHAGEEGSAEYMWEAIRLLHVKRIEHGVKCVEDPALVEYLKKSQLPLTVCPISNVKLRVFDKMKDHNLKFLLNQGLCVTINSDDPSYFGGYIVDNFIAAQQALDLTESDIMQLAKNGFVASRLSENQQKQYIDVIEKLVK